MLFCAISALDFLDANSADVPFVLFVLPIALCAVRFELLGGLASGAVGVALVVGWESVDSDNLGTIGYFARFAAFLLLGGLLGYTVRERRLLQERLSRYHDLSLDLICTSDSDGYFRLLNPAWESTLGFSETELMSRRFIDFVHPDDRRATEAEAAKLAAGHLTVNFSNRYLTAGGGYRWLEWKAQSVSSEGLIYATASDVTEKREAQEALNHYNERLESTVRERTRELEEARLDTLRRLAIAGEYRDADTYQHTERVGRTSALIATQIGLPQATVELIRLAAPLHDVGKIAIPDSILLTAGKLTAEQTRRMQSHVQAGSKLLSDSSSELLKLAEEIARTHHERWDGSGHPNGLTGEEIPISGRIVAVADVFDALTHDRHYKSAWTIADSVAEMRRLSGLQFDPAVIAAFNQLDAELIAGRLPLETAKPLEAVG